MLLQGTLHSDRLSSRILRNNPLGDPTDRELLVYLPPNCDASRRFPMVMVLPGFGATNRSLLNYEPWQPNLVQRFERLVLEGKSKPAILVLPDASNRWGGSQYLDSPSTGNYQRYLAEEVVAWVDQHYQTIPRKEARAVVGKSSGGFGALRLGLDYPDLFSAIGSHAGDLAFDISLRPLLQRAVLAFDRAGGCQPFIEQFFASARLDSLQFDGMLIVAVAAAYSPNRTLPVPHADFPFDTRTAELNVDVWQRWLEHDPLQRARRNPDAFAGTALVYLDAGDHDEHGLQFGARALYQLLHSRGVSVMHEEFPGGHRSTGHRYERSLPLLIDGLSDN